MKKLQMSAALLCLAMAACTNNDEVLVDEFKGIETISAEIIQPAGMSRIIVGDPVDGTYPMTWRADNPETKANEADVIYVYDSEGNAGRFIYNETAAAPKGIFVRDTAHGSPIKDIKNALCVPTSVGRASDLPKSIDGTFNYMSTMMYTRGAENAPMYGEFKDGALQFQIVTGMMELNIPNLTQFRAETSQMLGVKIEAFDKDGNKKYISATSAHIDFTEPTNPVLSLDAGQKEFIGLFLQKDVVVGNKLYFPLLTGEYGRIELSLYPNTSFSDPKKVVSTIVTLKPLAGNQSFTIEKKLYSVTKEFVHVDDAKDNINAPSLPGGDNNFEVK